MIDKALTILALVVAVIILIKMFISLSNISKMMEREETHEHWDGKIDPIFLVGDWVNPMFVGENGKEIEMSDPYEVFLEET